MKLLDCTLRDGGYYNNWDFDIELVNKYLLSMRDAKVDYVELGLRGSSENCFLGPFAYTSEKIISLLNLPESLNYTIMLNASDVLNKNLEYRESFFNSLFVEKQNSKITTVRIAAHFKDIQKIKFIAKNLKEKGYEVILNLMQAGYKPEQEFLEKIEVIKSWQLVDVLYFADSFGNMDAKEIIRVCKIFKEHWDLPFGIHAHDNMELAFSNSILASKHGVSFIDMTVTGMGRGAGNLKTENFLSFLQSNNLDKNTKKCNLEPLNELVLKDFYKLKRKYNYGSNILYFKGSQENIHPTYIQNLISDSRFDESTKLKAIDYLKKSNSSSFSGNLLDKALGINTEEKSEEINQGSSTLSNLFLEKDVLLLGFGDDLKKYKPYINQYIKTKNPIVIAININKEIEPEYIDYYILSHNSKIISEQKSYKKLKNNIIMPKHRFNQNELDLFPESSKILDYGLNIKERFLAENKQCNIVDDLTAAYALAILQIANAKNIFMLGFQGYEKGDVRQDQMLNILSKLPNSLKEKLISLDKTSYPIQQSSLFSKL